MEGTATISEIGKPVDYHKRLFGFSFPESVSSKLKPMSIVFYSFKVGSSQREDRAVVFCEGSSEAKKGCQIENWRVGEDLTIKYTDKRSMIVGVRNTLNFSVVVSVVSVSLGTLSIMLPVVFGVLKSIVRKVTRKSFKKP